MPVRLALCDLGAPGWGEPWFPHSAVLLYSQPGMAMLVMFLWSFVWFTAIPNIGMIQCYHSSPSIWRCWTGQPITFSLVCFWFCCFLGFGCVLCFVWCLFVVSLLLLDCDGSLDYVSVLASSSFWGFRRIAYVNALISQFTFLQHAIERVKRPGGSQEALDKKKLLNRCPSWCKCCRPFEL